MCREVGPALPPAQITPERNFSVPAGDAKGKLHISATLHYRKIDQFLLNYVMGDNSGLTAPVIDVASASADVCVSKTGDGVRCQ